MSAKWRALQHRHRYTYSSTAFPPSFLSSLHLPSPSPSSSRFLSALSHLSSLRTTFSQLPAATLLASSLPDLLSDPSLPPASASAAARLYLHILFLHNSLPLHRTLISGIIKSRQFAPVIATCLESLFREHAHPPGRHFLASRAALSLMSHPKLGFLEDTLGDCSVFVAADIVSGLRTVLRDGANPSPTVMEQCQEAMSCSYYLLQRFPSRFSGEGRAVFDSLVGVTVDVLRSAAFSRDCLVAAGVSFWAAMSVCWSQQELMCFISQGFFGFLGEDCLGELGTGRAMCGRDLYADVESISPLSRLCLIRGMLTSVPRSLLNSHFREPCREAAWTILYDGILTELCSYCENPIDSHFNFHTLTVMQICFQQIKTSIQSGIIDRSGGYDPIPEDVRNHILKIVWNNLEDPLSQTVKQVHLIFDLFLDIQTYFLLGEDNERAKIFLCKIASDLLCLGPRCKGRYVPLAFLTKRLGAKKFMDMSPMLLFETVHAYVDDDVCCAVTSFLKCFLEILRDECWNSDGIERGYEIFRGLCLPPLLQGLVSGLSKLRSNLNTYALPAILEVDVDSIFPMLAFISIGPKREEISMSHTEMTINQSVAALVSLVKVSRSLALIDGDIDWDPDSSIQNDGNTNLAIVNVKGINLKVPVEWLLLALTHADEHIRIDAAETLFLNPKTSSLPSSLELQLMRKAVPLNMRCCSTAFQMKWNSLFRKFFSRVKTALERQVKQGKWRLTRYSVQNKVADCGDSKMEIGSGAAELFSFMKWLSAHLFFSCYPSAPYERKMMAMALILILLDVWPAVGPSGVKEGIYPYDDGFVSADSTLLLVGSIIDSWDRLRESSYSILSRFPTPLPGISTCDSVKEVIMWAKKLVCSPRVRESDAGALTLRIIFKKYVVELGWIVKASVNVECFNSGDKLLNGDVCFGEPVIPTVEYLSSLVDWLRVAVEEGEKDLSNACKNSFVHGILLALRYTFEEMDWNSATILSSISKIKVVLENLLELIMRITSLALWVVSADAWYLPTDDNDTIDDIDVLDDVHDELDSSDSLEVVNGGMKPVDEAGPASQVVMVGCWLAMKEVSLLLGTVARKIPLPGSAHSSSVEINDSADETCNLKEMSSSDAVLNIKQLESIGNHFLQVLLKMKHNGAIDKTRAGFTALCNRLLSSNDPRLCKMTESWLEQLMERTTAKGQTVDDLLRRSAGIPAAFIALFLSEPEGTPKKLLPRALRWLIDVVNTSLPNSYINNMQNDHLSYLNSTENSNRDTKLISAANGRLGVLSKIRDEGVVPTVHSFNVLRAAFNDTNLAADTSGFAAEALIISIRSFSSQYWEVRNSACLAYTALVRRMIGFLNVHKRESARRALTGIEFFHRYPPLHPFLYDELRIATGSLPDGTRKHQGSNIDKTIHPSLCPILILLARLKPSLASSDPNDPFDPFLLMPFISRCVTQSNLRVRVLASRALTGLVSNERLGNAVVTIANSLPRKKRQMEDSMHTHSSSSTVNGDYGDAADSISFSSYNAIHGILLQLSTLVDSNCRNLTDNSKKEDIFRELILVLTKSSWLGSTESCCCPILNTSFLFILDRMLGIARTCKMEKCIDSIQNLLEELSLQYLDKKCSIGVTMFDPTEVELHKQVASSYFGSLFGGSMSEISKVQFHDRILYCLHNSRYEVRLVILKQIMQFLKSREFADVGEIHLWVNSNLQPTLVQMLDVEDNFKCIYYILRVIFTWNLLKFEKYDSQQHKCIVYLGTMDCGSVFDFWNKLVYLSSSVKHCKTIEALLSCMGICVRRFTLLLRRYRFICQSQIEENMTDTSISASWCEIVPKVFGYIDLFVSLVKQHSAPSEPVNMRRAAAESIISSGLLKEVCFLSAHVSNCEIPSDPEETSEMKGSTFQLLDPSRKRNMFAKKVLDAWSASIHMLEDEDVELRQKLGKDVQECITTSSQTNYHEMVPAQVEKIIQTCFEFLSSTFGNWIEYFNYLLQWSMEMTSHTISRKDLVRQVFDKEIDNHHEEKLLICQICCMHLEKFLSSPSWVINVSSSGISKHDIAIFVHRWRMKFLQQLISFGNEYIETVGGSDWIGGMGNHKDIFVAIYGNLLGLYALSWCQDDGCTLSSGNCPMGKQFSSSLDNIKVSLQPFLGNSLISNLYSLLMQSYHENSVHSTYSSFLSRECSGWEDFDPYFLLR